MHESADSTLRRSMSSLTLSFCKLLVKIQQSDFMVAKQEMNCYYRDWEPSDKKISKDIFTQISREIFESCPQMFSVKMEIKNTCIIFPCWKISENLDSVPEE